MPMKKTFLAALAGVLLFGSCAKEFNSVYKSSDYKYKYEYAKECFANGKYSRAAIILQEVIVPLKGSVDAQECLYMSTPEPRLDQTETLAAISAFQEYLDIYPDARYKEQAQQRLFSLQDKLVDKELYSAQLYYNLGSYFGNCTSGGNNYEACIVTAQNALKDYPYTKKREQFATLIMRSKYHLAEQSVEAKKLDRYQDAEDECYGFINEYPDSRQRREAESLIEKCKKFTSAVKD